MCFLPKAITIYSNEKTRINCKNNNKGGKLVYFQLVNKLTKLILHYQQLNYIPYQD